MSEFHHGARLDGAAQASIPVRPCQTICSEPVSLLPNSVYDGGVVPEGEGPADDDGETFEEWIPAVSSTTPAVSEAVRRY